MVSVTHKFTPASKQDGLNIQTWLESLSKSFAPAEVEVIRRACEFAEPLYAGHIEATGVPLLQHALGAAAILAGMNLDYETLVAAILHAVPEYLQNWTEKLEADFGKNISINSEKSSLAGLALKNRESTGIKKLIKNIIPEK